MLGTGFVCASVLTTQLSEFFASQFAEDFDESPPPSPPGLEGVPESHTKHGTARSTLFVPATAEGMLTLLEGQAPGDIDRFKAWHMDPEFHTISHVRPGLGGGFPHPKEVDGFAHAPVVLSVDSYLHVLGFNQPCKEIEPIAS